MKYYFLSLPSHLGSFSNLVSTGDCKDAVLHHMNDKPIPYIHEQENVSFIKLIRNTRKLPCNKLIIKIIPHVFDTAYYTVDICRYENLESLGKCFVPFVHTHLPSAFQGITFKCAR